MSHLYPERLAALIDEPPTPAELAHLAACRACRQERGAYEALADMSKNRLTLGQPLTSWSELAPALKRDGVIDTGRMPGRRTAGSRRWLQAAAAVMLLAGGAVIGRMSANVGVNPSVEATSLQALGDDTPSSSIAGRQSAPATLSTPAEIKSRIAALDKVTQVAGAALENAPYDSVINTIYLNAQGQREASMRMLNAASTRVTTY